MHTMLQFIQRERIDAAILKAKNNAQCKKPSITLCLVAWKKKTRLRIRA